MQQRYPDETRDMRTDPDSFAGGYFRHAVYNHWDPYEDIPRAYLENDRQKLIEDEPTQAEFEAFRSFIAEFGGGEEAVVDDLMPVALTVDSLNDEMFLTTQLYEEAKHLEFWERYWNEVLNPAGEALGYGKTYPTDDAYISDSYMSLFLANERRTHRLMEEGGNTPENLAKAVCTYHLVMEGVAAQTGYYTLSMLFGEKDEGVARREQPTLKGLVQGVDYIRSDEGRHVGWGVNKVKELVEEKDVEQGIVQDIIQEMMPDIAGAFQDFNDITDPNTIVDYARDKLTHRVEIITDRDADVPPVEELVSLE